MRRTQLRNRNSPAQQRCQQQDRKHAAGHDQRRTHLFNDVAILGHTRHDQAYTDDSAKQEHDSKKRWWLSVPGKHQTSTWGGVHPHSRILLPQADLREPLRLNRSLICVHQRQHTSYTNCRRALDLSMNLNYRKRVLAATCCWLAISMRVIFQLPSRGSIVKTASKRLWRS